MLKKKNTSSNKLSKTSISAISGPTHPHPPPKRKPCLVYKIHCHGFAETVSGVSHGREGPKNVARRYGIQTFPGPRSSSNTACPFGLETHREGTDQPRQFLRGRVCVAYKGCECPENLLGGCYTCIRRKLGVVVGGRLGGGGEGS